MSIDSSVSSPKILPDAKNSPISNQFPHSNQVVKEGRIYKKLGNLERLNKLRKVISTLFFKVLTFGIYQGKIQKWLYEFSTGKKEIKPHQGNPKKPVEATSNINLKSSIIDLKSSIIDLKKVNSIKKITQFIFQPAINNKTPLINDNLQHESPVIKPRKLFKGETPHKTSNDNFLKILGLDELTPVVKPPVNVEPCDEINHPNFILWLKVSEKDGVICQTEVYKTLKDLYEDFQNVKGKTQDEQTKLNAKFILLKDKISQIIESSPDNFSKITEQESNELIFNVLKNHFVDISEKVNGLPDIENGNFKANMLSLLHLVSKPLEQDEGDVEKDANDEEKPKEAPNTVIDYADFQNQIQDAKHGNAKAAFILFADLLKSDFTASKQKLQDYNQTEAKINIAIKKLAQPIQNLKDLALKAHLATDAAIKKELKEMNEVFSTIPNIADKPFFKHLLLQQNDQLALIYQLLVEKEDKTFDIDYIGEICKAKNNLKVYLNLTKKVRIDFAIKLGKEALLNPEKVFNHYLDINGGLQFNKFSPNDSSKIEKFLNKMYEILDEKSFSEEELLALEAFTSMCLYTYLINPQAYIDPNFNSIAHSLTLLRVKTQGKLNSKSMQSKITELRKSKENQIFYTFLKEKCEQNPDYPNDFWKNPIAAEKMKSIFPLVERIGAKIAEPASVPDSMQLIHKSSAGYEIYFQPGIAPEKPKLLFFVTKDPGYSMSQSMNHQLGLFGDPYILNASEQIASHINSPQLLQEYLPDLKNGEIEIVAAGFGNSGAVATIVGSRIALLYPKTHVTSIAAGSTTVVTTEDAYNIKQIQNFLPIRVKYIHDKNVDRDLSGKMADFSDDLYQTFPLLVSYTANSLDYLYKNNKEEYGNKYNFVPAMRNPLILRKMYQELSENLLLSTTKVNSPDTNHNDASAKSNLQLHAGKIDDLIKIGDQILAAKEDKDKFNNAYLKFDKQGLHLSAKLKEMEAFQQQQAEQKSWFWFGKAKTASYPVQTSILTDIEQKDTIFALQETIIHLKNPDVIKLLTPEKAFSLLVAADVMLINYTRINTNIGRLPQLINLLSEIRQIASQQLAAQYHDQAKNQKDAIIELFKKNGAEFELLAIKAFNLNPFYKSILNSKDLLGKIDYEDRFLEFLGFKIGFKNQDKIGSDSYVSKLYTAPASHSYDISLYTPDDIQKKQRIVISCNGEDSPGKGRHGLAKDFGAGDLDILDRAREVLKLDVIQQLKEQFKEHQFEAKDVDIVVTGFGTEGAVATALGSYLAEEFKECQVQSLGFGSPKFSVVGGVQRIQNQENFVPIRFLSPLDKGFEGLVKVANPVKDFTLDDNTYNTIPFEFRIVGCTELIGGHNTNLYGDVQGIKTSLKRAYLMRDVVREKKTLKALAAKEKSDNKPADILPKRVFVDNRIADLNNLSKDSIQIKDLQLVSPIRLIQIMEYCVELSESSTITDKQKAMIRSFFKKFIQAIRNENNNEIMAIDNVFFQKMVDYGYKPNQIFGGKWKLQQMISPPLEDAMNSIEKTKNTEQTIHPKKMDELLLTRNFYRGILAADLNGNRYKPAGNGVNGAVFFRNLESGLKKPENLDSEESCQTPFIGVFKPHPKTISDFKGWNVWFDAAEWAEYVKSKMGMEANLNQEDPDKRVNNEILAYELFHIFGFNSYIGFPTTLKFINKNDKVGRSASFCAFIPGLGIVGDHLNILDNSEKNYNQSELHIWQMSKIFDFLTGNMDGHEGNAFVKIEKDKVVGAVNFDYDKAFANHKTPKIGNQYKWANLAISKNDFTPDTRKALEEMLKDENETNKIKAFLDKAREESKKYFSPNQEKLLRERIDILKLIAKGEIKQLSHLAQYK